MFIKKLVDRRIAGRRIALNYICVMDEEEKAINARAEENSLSDTPTDEVKQPEVESESVQPEKTEISTETTDTKGERKVSGAEKRIHELVDERDEARRRAEDLSTKLAELTAQPQPEAENAYKPEDTGGDRELTLDDLRTIARLEVEKERTISRINAEAAEAQKFYPELDKNSDAFDADVNEAVTTAVWLEIQKNPNQSVMKLTDKYMKPYLKAAERAVGQEKETLAKQASETALRPSTYKGTDKKTADKSIEELEAELEIVH